MNRYRVAFRIDGNDRAHIYDVHASSPHAAISFALTPFDRRAKTQIDVSIQIHARDVFRFYDEPKVRFVEYAMIDRPPQ